MLQLHVFCLLLLSFSALGFAKDYVLEHSFAGGDYSQAGIIEDDVLSQVLVIATGPVSNPVCPTLKTQLTLTHMLQDSGLVLTRVPLADHHHSQLKQAVEQDGYASPRCLEQLHRLGDPWSVLM